MENKSIQSIKIGIVGIGLIGGSIARALTEKAGIKSISAVDSDEASLKKALNDGSITKYSMDLKDLYDCDLIYICVPVGSIPSMLDNLSSWYSGIVTDVASTKEQIVSYAGSHYPTMRFIGGHPMAGSEKVGYASSKENLFENAPYILCKKTQELDTNLTGKSLLYGKINIKKQMLENDVSFDNDFDIVRKLAILMDAVPVEMSPKEHDIAVGLISHLPHIVAYSLVNAVQTRGDGCLKSIAAGGFRDITRIASSDPALWTDILCDSGKTIAELLEEYINILNQMKDALKLQDRQTLLTMFSKAKDYRDQLPMTPHSRNQTVQLWIEVDDKPGMIGRIAVLFGDHGINIKNMNIQDNRAYEGGSLRITLSSTDDAKLGEELLKKELVTVRIIE